MLGTKKKKESDDDATTESLLDNLADLEALERDEGDINALLGKDEDKTESETSSDKQKAKPKSKNRTFLGGVNTPANQSGSAVQLNENVLKKLVKNSAHDYSIVGLLGKGAYGVVYQALINDKTQRSRALSTGLADSANQQAADQASRSTSPTTEEGEGIRRIASKAGEGIRRISSKAVVDLPEGQFNYAVAIKVIDLEKPKSSLEDINNEVTAMKEASHPNVVACYTSFIHKSALWVVMPYMNLGCCANIMKRLKKFGYGEGMREEWVKCILKETIKGLNYLHEQGYMHRDLKAGNIVLDSSGSIKLADFGVSGLLVTAAAERKVSQTFVGTPCWMAPEIIEQAKGHDSSADIWSLGIVALELGKGYPPYARFEHFTIILKTLQEDPPSLKSYEDEKRRQPSPGTEWCRNSQRYKDFLGMCLRKKPQERYSAKKLLTSKFISKAMDPKACCNEIITKLPNLSAVQDTKPELLQGLIRRLMLDTRLELEEGGAGGSESNSEEKKKKKYHLAAAKKDEQIEEPKSDPKSNLAALVQDDAEEEESPMKVQPNGFKTSESSAQSKNSSAPSELEEKTDKNKDVDELSDDLKQKMEALSSVPRAEGTTWIFNFKSDDKKKTHEPGSSIAETVSEGSSGQQSDNVEPNEPTNATKKLVDLIQEEFDEGEDDDE